MKLTNADIRNQITNQLIDAIEKGSLPWRQQFTPDPNSGLATSLSSGKKYNGINQLLLALQSYKSKFWGTFKAINFAGGHVRRGEKATKICLFNPIKKTKTDKHGVEQTSNYLIYKQFAVFNAEQCENLDEYQVGYANSQAPMSNGCEEADKIIEATGANIEFGTNQPAYYTNQDKIVLPHRRMFESSSAFYETAFHEISHWAHHPSRLNPPKRPSDEEYAFNELVAEISACYLMSECNLSLNSSNHGAYLKSWLRGFQNSPQMIFAASALASRTCDLVLSFSRNESSPVETDEVIPF